MTTRKPKYTYEKRRSCWVVMEWDYGDRCAVGRKIRDHLTFDQARDEVYRLNGWKAHSNSPKGGEKEKAHGRL